MKPLYDIPEAGNHWFVIYHTHHKEKLGMTESTYSFYLFYKSGPLEIVEMQTDDTLILADNNLTSNEKKAIKIAKPMIKNCKYLTSV